LRILAIESASGLAGATLSVFAGVVIGLRAKPEIVERERVTVAELEEKLAKVHGRKRLPSK
jgi:hypothetical protein